MRTAAILGLAVGLAFVVRVVPAWDSVFTPAGVNFQDSDCWAHMRAVRDLAAHFPTPSSFDPYGVFPGAPTTRHQDLWDFGLATVAWVLGAGHPTAALVDQTGAWIPPVLGALFPIPVFFLARWLFGNLAAGLAALITAILPGTLLWVTHLGVPDHHVAEGLLSFLALLSLCKAVISNGRAAIGYAALAGVFLGLYFDIRAAGIFVPAAFALSVLLVPVLAPLVAGTLVLSGAIFIAGAESNQAGFTLYTLACCIAICAVVWVLDRIWRGKQWPAGFLLPAIGIAGLAAVGIVAAAQPAIFTTLVHTIRGYLPGAKDAVTGTVTELAPVWRVPPRGFAAIYANLGGLWPIAILFLLCCVLKMLRERNPALTLFTVWGIVMTIGGFLQTRMDLYLGPVIAITGGAALAWIISEVARRAARLRVPTIAIAVSLAFAVNLPAAWQLSHLDGGVNPNWRAAFQWLARNTPEPLGDARAWDQLWTPGDLQAFHYPASAYGVLTWWDYGYPLNFLAHRIPNASGGQTNAAEVAAFLTATEPDRAHLLLNKLGTRYVMVDPTVMTSYWAGIVVWTGQDDSRYRKLVIAITPQGPRPMTIYLPDYYKSMATRLYAFDGQASGARTRFSVFTTHKKIAASGESYDVLISEQEFPTEQKAWDFMAVNRGEDAIIASADPTVSCVDLKALPWARRTFTSDNTELSADRTPKAVKIFEVTP